MSESGTHNFISSKELMGKAGISRATLNNYIKICAPKGNETDPEVYKSMVKVVGVWGRVRLGE